LCTPPVILRWWTQRPARGSRGDLVLRARHVAPRVHRASLPDMIASFLVVRPRCNRTVCAVALARRVVCVRSRHHAPTYVAVVPCSYLCTLCVRSCVQTASTRGPIRSRCSPHAPRPVHSYEVGACRCIDIVRPLRQSRPLSRRHTRAPKRSLLSTSARLTSSTFASRAPSLHAGSHRMGSSVHRWDPPGFALTFPRVSPELL
jgi:hypothetical protein